MSTLGIVEVAGIEPASARACADCTIAITTI